MIPFILTIIGMCLFFAACEFGASNAVLYPVMIGTGLLFCATVISWVTA